MNLQLESVERSNGATFARFADCELPARFTDTRSEWAAVRQRCGLLDARFRTLLRMTGTDRVTFLQGMVSNDVSRLHDGEGTYAVLLTQQGKVVSDLRIYQLADAVWLDVPASRAAVVRESLERFIIADDVEFVDDEAWAPLVVLEGPLATRAVLGVAGEHVEAVLPFGHRELTFDGTRLRLIAATHSGERGYLLCGAPQVAAHLWERCQAAGAEPVGMEALDVLRVEAGIPWHGRDMNESTLVGEVGLDQAISYTKGCYLGQEVVERVAARGQVHRKLVGIVCDGQQLPPPDSKLLHGGTAVGWVTSAVWSPARETVIALGYLRREHWNPGSELQVGLAEGAVVAGRVVALPFYVPGSV